MEKIFYGFYGSDGFHGSHGSHGFYGSDGFHGSHGFHGFHGSHGFPWNLENPNPSDIHEFGDLSIQIHPKSMDYGFDGS